MFCDQCGTEVRDDQRFCHSCGKAFPIAPSPASTPTHSARGRVAKHAGVLGVFWILWSFFHLFPVFLGGMMGWAGWPFRFHGAAFRHAFFFGAPMIATLGTLLALGALVGIAGGVGLLTYKPWARVLLLVLGCLSLINIPFGTVLGAYTLWVLLPREAEQEMATLAAPR